MDRLLTEGHPNVWHIAGGDWKSTALLEAEVWVRRSQRGWVGGGSCHVEEIRGRRG